MQFSSFFLFFSSSSTLLYLSPPWSCMRYVFCYQTVTPIPPFFSAPLIYIQHPSSSFSSAVSLSSVLCVDSLSRYTRLFHFINIRNPNVYTQLELSLFPPLAPQHSILINSSSYFPSQISSLMAYIVLLSSNFSFSFTGLINMDYSLRGLSLQ